MLYIKITNLQLITADVKSLEICDCPFELEDIVRHTKYGNGKVVKIEGKG